MARDQLESAAVLTGNGRQRALDALRYVAQQKFLPAVVTTIMPAFTAIPHIKILVEFVSTNTLLRESAILLPLLKKRMDRFRNLAFGSARIYGDERFIWVVVEALILDRRQSLESSNPARNVIWFVSHGRDTEQSRKLAKSVFG